MKYGLLTSMYALLSANIVLAQQDPARQFDFWIGEWQIEQQIRHSDGSWLSFEATNEVKYILDSTVIAEHWQGEVQFFWDAMDKPDSLKGFSLRYYDEKIAQWRIFWMDNRHPQLGNGFSGSFMGPGTAEFFRKNEEGESVARISFAAQGAGEVLWELAVPSGESDWKVVWKMYMTRKG